MTTLGTPKATTKERMTIKSVSMILIAVVAPRVIFFFFNSVDLEES